MGLLDFIQAGPQRRQWLDETVGDFVESITPPNLRPAAGLLAQMNPVQGMADSMSSFDVATDRSRSMDERRRGAINSVVEGLLAVAPAAVASRGYMTPAQGVMEGLLGWSPSGQQIADDVGRFWVDEAGNISWNDLPMYHGTPDARDVLDSGGFSPRNMSAARISDLQAWDELSSKMAGVDHGSDEYFKLLDERSALRPSTSYRKPLFMTPERSMAATYADDTRAFDYQNAEPAVLGVSASPQNILDVSAGGSDFRGISKNAVETGLRNAGVPQESIDDAMKRFIFAARDDGKISTDDLSVIAQELGFDAVDVSNVKDAYMGGGLAGRVRMVFDPSGATVVSKNGEPVGLLSGPVTQRGATVKPQIGESFDSWIDRIYAPENRGAGNVVQDENVVFRAMSPAEADAGEAAGVFRDITGSPLYVANDPERYIGGGAYGGKRQGRIYEFDVSGMPSDVRQGGVGIQERAINEIPTDRIRRVWEWNPKTQAHELISDNTTNPVNIRSREGLFGLLAPQEQQGGI